MALLLPGSMARAELPATIKGGILHDMNSPFADQSGPGSVMAAQMAAGEFAAGSGGFKVEILSADHLNKPDTGAQGGKVLGSVKHALGTIDFSSCLLQAQSPGAKVIALATTGTDLTNDGQAGGGVRHQPEADPCRVVHPDRRCGFNRPTCRAGGHRDRGNLLGPQ